MMFFKLHSGLTILKIELTICLQDFSFIVFIISVLFTSLAMERLLHMYYFHKKFLIYAISFSLSIATF